MGDRVGIGQRLTSWAQNHARNLVASLGDMWRHPASSVLTAGVIGITLSLPAGLSVVVDNGRALAAGWDRAARISVFMVADAGATEARALRSTLLARADVGEVELLAPEVALEEFRAHSGFGEALSALDQNPLPYVLVVTPGLSATGASQVDALASTISAAADVDQVVVDTAWIARFQALMGIVQRAVTLIALLLAVAVVIIVGNTIRLDIQHRSAEIEVMKLIGASDAFIRRPFLYSGLWYGIGGGVLAWVLVSSTLLMLDGPVQRLAGLYGSGYQLDGLGPAGVVGLMGAGSLLGWLGSWLAVGRHLRSIEPR